jgi:predicted regulator of Ras-like GTPase activity (Roadblock/LC7/MglB family)
MAALAAGSFCATQAIAERVGEANFSNIYQQGSEHSLFVSSIDENLLLIVIFKAALSVGVIKFYAAKTVAVVAAQLTKAQQRTPGANIDLVSLNLLNASEIFRRKSP